MERSSVSLSSLPSMFLLSAKTFEIENASRASLTNLCCLGRKNQLRPARRATKWVILKVYVALIVSLFPPSSLRRGSFRFLSDEETHAEYFQSGTEQWISKQQKKSEARQQEILRRCFHIQKIKFTWRAGEEAERRSKVRTDESWTSITFFC